jgi:hypothetical protein
MEKEVETVHWDDFVKVITSPDVIYRYTYINTSGSGIESKANVLRLNSVDSTLWLHFNTFINQKYNENVEIKDGGYIIYKKVWDEEEVGEEEGEDNDGNYYKLPIMKRLNTYQLIPIRVEIFKKVQL